MSLHSTLHLDHHDLHMTDSINWVALALFTLAILHTFCTGIFERLAHQNPRHAGLWHLLGEVEVVFGLWAMVLFVALVALQVRATRWTMWMAAITRTFVRVRHHDRGRHTAHFAVGRWAGGSPEPRASGCGRWRTLVGGPDADSLAGSLITEVSRHDRGRHGPLA